MRGNLSYDGGELSISIAGQSEELEELLWRAMAAARAVNVTFHAEAGASFIMGHGLGKDGMRRAQAVMEEAGINLLCLVR